MTAYGNGERDENGHTYVCEVRSLNSRFLEVNVRLPRHLLALEIDVINQVKQTLRRGKVDVFLDVVRTGTAKDLPALDHEAARHYLALAAEAARLGQPLAPMSFSELARLEGVLASGPRARGLDAAEAHRSGLFGALDRALAAAIKARVKEGAALGEALKELLQALEAGRVSVAALRDQILPALHKNVLRRVDGVLALLARAGASSVSGVPEERLAQEVALLSDKADIDEELTRLATHIKEFERLMAGEEGAGRKLDFLCQEMHREVNTMSNKLVQTEVAQHTLEMKQLIERIRQQVQNLE
jgi:uncharacterized protein (TIGR00255 family)